jgi:hypothetical protein
MEGARVQVPPRVTYSELMITMLKCNCRCCSHVVDVEHPYVRGYRAAGWWSGAGKGLSENPALRLSPYYDLSPIALVPRSGLE